ncbi:MAG: hypothetical protein LBB98_13895 [Treponema sp.]|nr:hypothetical protein [Treponema sp.]
MYRPHGSQLGTICPVQRPEGGKCGLEKHIRKMDNADRGLEGNLLSFTGKTGFPYDFPFTQNNLQAHAW